MELPGKRMRMFYIEAHTIWNLESARVRPAARSGDG
jgi:hypothetical protein